MKSCVMFLILMLVGIMPFQPVSLSAQDVRSGHGNPEPPMAGIQWARGHAPDHSAHAGGASSSSPNLIWHGGNIMFTTETTSIFWGQQQC